MAGAGVLSGLANAAKTYADYTLAGGERQAALTRELATGEASSLQKSIDIRNQAALSNAKMQLDYSIMDEKAQRDWQAHLDTLNVEKEKLGVMRDQAATDKSYKERTASSEEKKLGQAGSSWVYGASHKDQMGGPVNQAWWDQQRKDNPGMSDEQIATKNDLIPQSKWEMDIKLKELARQNQAKPDEKSLAADARYDRLMLSVGQTGVSDPKLYSGMMRIIANDQVRNGDWNLKPKDYSDVIKTSAKDYSELDQDTKDQYTLRGKVSGLSGQALFTYENLNTLQSTIGTTDEGTAAGRAGLSGERNASEIKLTRDAEARANSFSGKPNEVQLLKDAMKGAKEPEIKVYQDRLDKLSSGNGILSNYELTPAAKSAVSTAGSYVEKNINEPLLSFPKYVGALGSSMIGSIIQKKK